MKSNKTELIEIKLSWRGVLPVMITLLQQDNAEAKQEAMNQLTLMSKIADLATQSVPGNELPTDKFGPYEKSVIRQYEEVRKQWMNQEINKK